MKLIISKFIKKKCQPLQFQYITIILNNLQDIDTSIDVNNEDVNQLLLNICNNDDTHEMIYTLIRQYQILK